VSNDVEALLYTHAEELGITVITISHRPSLFKYHNFLLHVGEGEDGTSWIWSKIGSSEGLVSSMDEQITKLQAQLKNVDPLKKRLAAINKELNLTR
jgi:ATP-binding cassette, subfamily D (ALD), peroxisomal long-chain fatty acid import protein